MITPEGEASTTEEILIGDQLVRITRVIDSDKLFDDLLSQSEDDIERKDERLPYWAEVWPSAIGLSEFILDNKSLLNARSVLEIGCGLGLPGIVAGKISGQVVLTDYMQEPLKFAAHNWKLNHDTEANCRIFDWRTLPAEIDSDIYIASDVAYETRSFAPLKELIIRVINAGKEFWISEPSRIYAQTFFSGLNQENIFLSSTERLISFRGLKHRIHIHRLGKAG